MDHQKRENSKKQGKKEWSTPCTKKRRREAQDEVREESPN